MPCSCSQKQNPVPCCPPFKTELWQDQEIAMKNQLFIKDHVACFLHIPINIKKMFIKNMKLIEAADARPANQIWLEDETSSWGADYYIQVSKNIEGVEMATISGTFLTKVFEGPYRNTGKWIKEMKEYVTSKGKTFTKLYFYYPTCPKCSKFYGKNYIVILAKIA